MKIIPKYIFSHDIYFNGSRRIIVYKDDIKTKSVDYLGQRWTVEAKKEWWDENNGGKCWQYVLILKIK